MPWLGEAEGYAPPTPGHDGGLLLLWESANSINPVLTWNQGPVAWLAEAIRLAANFSQGAAAALAVVQRLAPLVLATGDAYSDLPFLNETTGCYEIGPCVFSPAPTPRTPKPRTPNPPLRHLAKQAHAGRGGIR